MPYDVWNEGFGLPASLLLRLRKMAIWWQLQYPGLSERDREVCEERQQRDNEQKRQLRAQAEEAEGGEGGETIV